eukprot:TRINITY_DN28296_c0_g1_i1.p3 TRINITY_DN28296_c0_g1~~TRINITY_DN28296_c0_g1_i1.p3  ORF type:complete len:127 (+),score=10.96 TRINITY_DN28296_c0_g1_i1:394-774(+)
MLKEDPPHSKAFEIRSLHNCVAIDAKSMCRSILEHHIQQVHVLCTDVLIPQQFVCVCVRVSFFLSSFIPGLLEICSPVFCCFADQRALILMSPRNIDKAKRVAAPAAAPAQKATARWILFISETEC